MAAANIVRSAFGGLLKKCPTLRGAAVSRVSAVALQHNCYSMNASLTKYNSNSLLINKVRICNEFVIFSCIHSYLSLPLLFLSINNPTQYLLLPNK